MQGDDKKSLAFNAVAQSYQNVLNQMRACASSVLGKRSCVRLIAVSKGHSTEKVVTLCKLGQQDFGENKIQEGVKKIRAINAMGFSNCWHMIGRLQTNKIADAVRYFDYIHTLDRPRLANALSKQMQLQGRFPKVFIQVNAGKEAQKSGVMPEEVRALTAYCRQLNLPVVGYMCIPPKNAQPAKYFNDLSKLAKSAGLLHLSMGMSQDFKTAIGCGATFVRVGSSIFGDRVGGGQVC